MYMIIGVDGNEANVGKKVGVSVYTFELLHYFHKNASENIRFVIYLREKPHSDMPFEKDNFIYRVVPGKILWSQIFLPLALYSKQKPDVFFAPAHYAPRFCPCPTVVTIHDLSYFYYPQEFLIKDLIKLKNWTKYSLKNAKRVIAVSKNTKKDTIKFYDVDKNKITVIYNGFIKKSNSKAILNEIKTTNIDEIIQSNYFLYVGTIQPRKNIETLIESFALFRKEKPDFKLIIVGKKGWLYKKIFKRVIEQHLEDKVIFTGFWPDLDLAQLYQHARAFIMPSLYEGFGIPILEAMNFSCPVLSSNTSSLPEIGGDACLYFDPNDTMELKRKMLEIIENEQMRKDLIEKGKERAKQFSWEKCGKETLKILQSFLLSS